MVIFESTVYPGTTEEICVPILERISRLKLRKDDNYKILTDSFFNCGYAPERINPHDRTHLLPNTNKIICGSNKKITLFIKNFIKQL